MSLIANARMYAVTPKVEVLWDALLERVLADAGVAMEYVPYPAPQPLETFWARPDLGCVFMCGYPLVLGLASVTPLVAPVPRAEWARGRPVYRSDLIVRGDAPYRTLEDTFGGRAGWTVEHSQSGFNAFRHHLLRYRSASRPVLYGSMAAHLVTARNVLDSVREGRIDVGPLDAYWHMLIARHEPHLTAGVRVLESTDTVTMPAFVTSTSTAPEITTALRRSFLSAAQQPWFAEFAEELLIEGFAAVERSDFDRTLAWHDAALAAGYPYPA